MNCLAPERFIDLLDRGGLDAVSPEEQAHFRECDACCERWATVATAEEVLTEARPKQPGRAVRLIPLVAAAAILLTIVGIIAAGKRPLPVIRPLQDPVTLFFQGTPDESKVARAALLRTGRSALAGLVAARPKWSGSARFPDLQNLIWAIKRESAQDPAATPLLDKLETMKVDLQFSQSRVEDILFFLRDMSRMNLVLDPTIDGGKVDLLSVKDATLRSTLETLCSVSDLDFDVKYGVVFLSRPLRLWSTDPAVGLPAANLWRAGSPLPSDALLAEKLHSVRVTLDAQNSPLSAVAAYFQEISKLKMVETPGADSQMITVKMEDVPMEHAIELITLPFGWDARIDNGSVVLFNPKK